MKNLLMMMLMLIFIQNSSLGFDDGCQASTPVKNITLGINSILSKMKSIPKGTFKMGSPVNELSRGPLNENQVDVIITKDFFMMDREVTQEEWFLVTGQFPSYYRRSNDCPLSYMRISSKDGICPKLPVENIKWEEVVCFIQIFNEHSLDQKVSLPTEAQWEYSARSGVESAYDKNQKDVLNYAWIFYNSPNGIPHDVATLRPNKFGLYDMIGNVWEFVQDYYSDQLTGGTDPLANVGYEHTLRGGSFLSSYRQARFAMRRSYSGHGGNGFRLVLKSK